MKRKRRSLQEGLPAGERLKRSRLASTDAIWASPWGWVGTDVFDASSISQEHLTATCGFLPSSGHAFCKNKLRVLLEKRDKLPKQPVASGNQDNVIVVSDDDIPGCSKKSCKKNPNCLNHLGQGRWVDQDDAFKSYRTAIKLEKDPSLSNRKPGLPIGLRNLGATCYANAYLQVWFQDVEFRNGVYRCLPTQDQGHAFEDSPVFQLQTVFAALQGSKRKVFNPVKLVESLRLRTSEQQDAQEFSKLFMSHLDSEFQKQLDPELKNLLSRQFEGTQAYTTTCQRCKTCSSNDSNFLELELNLENNATLESRIQALLHPEVLSGDNQYRCSHCSNSLQDAKRQVILRRLPPVLHFSLLRFIFDLTTLERKKSKHPISFPTILDMSQFIRGSNEDNIYELRGFLLHRGQSAYHGHYEAVVQEAMSETWFQFNDEIVTEIPPPGSIPGSKDIPRYEKYPNSKSQASKKRKRIVDSEDEIEEIDPPPNTKQNNNTDFSPFPGSRIVNSKDAYMLVYTRKRATKPTPIDPPQRACEVIDGLNSAHDTAVDQYRAKLEQVKEEFNGTREKMLSIFQSWDVSSADQPSVVASRRALEDFVSRPLTSPSDKLADQSKDAEPAEAERSNAEANGHTPGELSVVEIICPHGRLSPDKASEMKRIDAAVYNEMESSFDVRFSHVLTPEDVCETCVKEAFPEKLYHKQHPQQVAEFDKVRQGMDTPQYWLSKNWTKDWRQAKPKMHIAGQDDPGPSSGEFYRDVFCEHGNLVSSLVHRTRISPQAYHYLRTLFPGWSSIPDNAQACKTCIEAIELSRGERQAMKKRAEDEKVQLRKMFDHALKGDIALLEDTALALVPSSFVRGWRHWNLRFATIPRPPGIDNSAFLCEHDLLAFDPNKGDIDETMCIVLKSDWETLQRLYDAGPPIFLARHTRGGKTTYTHKPEVCQECRVARKSAYESTEITVRVLAEGDPLPTPESYRAATMNGDAKQTPQTYASRQSKRLRTGTRRREHKLTISKSTTVKALKLQIFSELQIPTICQRLFRAGEELLDNSISLGTLGVLAHDVLELREESEDQDLLDVTSDGENGRREEGRGFGGTLLGGDFLPSESGTLTSSRSASERGSSPPEDSGGFKQCGACTLRNPLNAVACSVCDTPFP
ncbi:cysteine proteinase [Vararia minispora EC-137]|uniref:Cysteine proteinase n=1 Tax=Vararia minispora EC-137 TaxID=1314806 RepID=A0ACB8QLH6_9AGAM|nr:cysteine proteinase [Vararia minispora EC-137]